MYKISIVVPTLNEEEFLPDLLESIKKQSYKDYEVIVADAGSKDKTREIAESFGARVVEGGMPGVGRNRGAAASNGDFLFFFDADVTIPPDFLEKAIGEIKDKFIDLATCEFYPDSDLRLDKLLFHFANLSVKLNQSSNPHAAGFCIFISKRLFDRIGGFDESLKLAEDHDLVKRAAKFRDLHILESVKLTVSIRRLSKEGRFSLIEKYFQVEWHLLTKGNIRSDIVEYEFGNYAKDSQSAGEKPSKILDDFEKKLIDLEMQYNEISAKYLSPEAWQDVQSRLVGKYKEGVEKLKSVSDTFSSVFKGFLNKDK